MAMETPTPRIEDVTSVGTRIRWGAILAGGVLAMGIYFLLGILGAAVGLSVSDRMDASTLTNAALVWTLITSCVAVFLGGMVASLFTVGENKIESMMYGVIMWAMLFAFFVSLGAAGVRTGFNAMVDLSTVARNTTTDSWETSAKQAGITDAQIADWKTTLSKIPGNEAKQAELRKTLADGATRVTWYAFLGMWISMMAAAAGAVFGAGPTFRVVVRSRSNRSWLTSDGQVVNDRTATTDNGPLGRLSRETSVGKS
jgi:hypothetical protein